MEVSTTGEISNLDITEAMQIDTNVLRASWINEHTENYVPARNFSSMNYELFKTVANLD